MPARTARFRAFADCNAGALTIVFAVSLVVIMLCLGSGIDYLNAHRVKSKLTEAADSAVLAASRTGMDQLAAGNTNWHEAATTAGNVLFDANRATIGESLPVVSTLTSTQSGTGVTSTMNFSTPVPSNFLKIIGKSSITVSNSVTAVVDAGPYSDVHLLVDNSAHMGIGATAADQQTLMTAIGCTLACHYNNVWSETDSLAQARASGATLRLDVVKQATVDALTSLKGTPAIGRIRVSVSTFSNSLVPVLSLTTDIDAVIAAVKNIELVGQNLQGGTNVAYALKELAQSVSSPAGDGTASHPLGYILLATDGIENSNQYLWSGSVGSLMTARSDPNFPSSSPRRDFPSYGGDPTFTVVDPADCSPLKAIGYTVMALNMTYLVPTVAPDSSDVRYKYIKDTLLPLAPSRMAACASSPALSISATSPTEIKAAMAGLFSKIKTSSLQLTH